MKYTVNNITSDERYTVEAPTAEAAAERAAEGWDEFAGVETYRVDVLDGDETVWAGYVSARWSGECSRLVRAWQATRAELAQRIDLA